MDSNSSSKPQEDLVYNQHLPYYGSLKAEAADFFKQIKSNLCRSVLLSESYSLSWVENVVKYVKLYGRHFSKEDHVFLVKLFLEVIVVDDLDFRKVHWFTAVLYDLLKKPDLLSPDDLTIEWRPLYKLYSNMMYNSNETYGLHAVPESFELTFKLFLKKARIYFPLSATQEILDELRPLLCVYNNYSISKATTLLNLFLPTLMKPEDHCKGFKLWLEELLDLWDRSRNEPSWENNLICLFSQVAKDNIGYINWDPWIPTIFTHLLRSFNIISGSRRVNSKRILNVHAVSAWIVSMLGGPSSMALAYVAKLFSALESYYHPSNYGKWIIKLSQFLAVLPLEFINRLHEERYRKKTWRPEIPDNFKLKENEITQFVNILKPILLIHMFSRTGAGESAYTWQLLSTVRPEIVIPPLIEKLYSALETITEPHRLLSSLQCAFSISRKMVSSNKYYPEGQTHVIPLLFQALPGLDPNDIRKCMMTFQFISIYVTLIPIIDCSSAIEKRNDLSEHEYTVCLATSQFEDFILQFIDKCFGLIENNSFEFRPERRDNDSIRLNSEEGMTELGLTSCLSSILYQCSNDIFAKALKKVYSYVSNRILETKVAGKYAGNMCRVFAKVNPELSLKTFLPHFCKLVLTLTESDDVLLEDNLDQQLLFGLQLLSEVVRCDGKCLLPYKDLLIQVLKRSLRMESRSGYTYAASLLRFIFKSLTTLYTLEFRSLEHPWEDFKDFSEKLPLRYWGKPGSLKHLNIKWHLPNDEEIEFAQYLLDEFAYVELDNLTKWSNGQLQLSREALNKSLTIIMDSVNGLASSLPMWSQESIDLPESCDPKLHKYKSTVPFTDYVAVVKETGMRPISFSSGENVREKVGKVMRLVCKNMLSNHEDDIKSLILVVKIMNCVLFYSGIVSNDLDNRWKSFRMVKKAMENKLEKNKRHIRGLLIDRVALQHELRLKNSMKSAFTTLHSELLDDLFSLSISHYSVVRSKAQETLFTLFKHFNFSHLLLLPKIVDILSKKSDSTHEQFKGTLYVLLGKKDNSIVSFSNWDLLNVVWISLINGKYSEKPSIINLMGKISETIHKSTDGSWIFHVMSDSCKAMAKRGWIEGVKPSDDCPSDDEIEIAKQLNEERNLINVENYEKLVKSLVNLIDDGNLHWRYNHLAFALLCLLVRSDVKLPKDGVKTIVNNLICETLSIRKLSVKALAAILKQQKRPHPKRKFIPQEQSNQWLQFQSGIDYFDENVWRNTVFVEKIYVGFYCWPQNGIDVYEPESKQPNLNRSYLELDQVEKPIFDFFTNKENVDKLFSFLSLEERKGHDKFSAKRFQMFKGLFRNFGLLFLSQFQEKLCENVTDSHESAQRCAAEVIAGMLRGSKHWSFDDLIKLREFVEPLMRKMLENLTTETFRDWGTCIATCFSNCDGRKMSWLVKLLVEDPLQSMSLSSVNESTTSFLQASRIYCLLGVVQQQNWRGLTLLKSLLDYLIQKDHLRHCYQNVRERIGFLLSTIFLHDIDIRCLPDTLRNAPKKSVFLEYVLPKLEVLTKEETEVTVLNGCSSCKTDEEKEAFNLLKTVCRWIFSSYLECPNPIPVEFFTFLPILCEIQSETKDEEMVRESTVAITLLSHALLTFQTLKVAISTCKEIIKSKSWHARSALTKFLQFLVSSNLFTIMNNAEMVEDITDLILTLLEDERIEVREVAAQTVGDLVHCEFFKVNDALINRFRIKCKTVIRKSRNEQDFTTTYNTSDLVQRHSGVLGLCAMVNAFPYDVPDFLPTILMLLAEHVTDPQPIAGTVKKTLSNFRRTHLDSWRDHKLKFSEDQLSVITDLLISPSYYA